MADDNEALISDEIELDAQTENLPSVIEFVETFLDRVSCPMKSMMQISVAVDEIFTNISSYAYHSGIGKAKIYLAQLTDPRAVQLTFIDSGVPYDPLAKEDPDVTLSASERQIGGLGIFMAKKLMDEVKYEYRDGKNILRMKKYL
ncbi:MAG: ATP-binding protein [Flexilinea sp.]|nr:ATP-binding protein [Flexilinea sp.]